ncbi:MAG: CoA transferase [Stellaceae bacterium]
MSQALAGIRVIDFTHDQAGPSCTQMLAWLGADVIKIERPPHGDRARRLWNMDNPEVDSFFFLLLNSSKRSIVLDLKTDEGKEVARRLVAECDVVAENLGPGVMERLGLGWEAVHQLNPRAVYASVKGFGSYGPYSGFKCFEPVAQATSGAMSVTGERPTARRWSTAPISAIRAPACIWRSRSSRLWSSAGRPGRASSSRSQCRRRC